MKTSTLHLLTAALALASVASTTARAHALWVGSNRYLLEYPGKTPAPLKATLFTGWGHRLPIDEPVTPERFGGIDLIAPDGSKKATAAATDGYHAATIEIAQAGAWLATSWSKPAFSSQVKNDDGTITYFSVPKNEVPAGKKVAETNYIRVFAKSLIYVSGAGATDGALAKPVGHELELVPLKNPALAKVGDKVPVQVLFKGKPYKGDPIEVTSEHIASPHLGKSGFWSGETDAEGRVEIPINHNGVWTLLVTIFDPATGELVGKADQTRFRSTFTFEVPGAAKTY